MKNLDKNDVKSYYKNHTRKETALHFNCSIDHMKRFLKKNGITKSVNDVMKTRQKDHSYSPAGDLMNVSTDVVSEYYSHHTRVETAKRFNVTERQLRTFLERNGIQRKAPGFHGDARTDANRVKAVREHYADHDESVKSHRKMSDTMRERYGDSHYNSHKAFESYKRKTGYDNPLSDPDVHEKSKKTMMDRYGADNPLAVPEFKIKVAATNVKRYGHANPLNAGSMTRDRRDATMIELYGDEVPLRVAEIKYRAMGTLVDRYGVPNAGLIHAADKESEEEMSLIPVMIKLGLTHNDMTGKIHPNPFFIRFSDGYKCPDFFDAERKIAVEYNGSYWHQDEDEPGRWLDEWSGLGWDCSIIWDFERKGFLSDPPKTIARLLSQYPCSYRK